MLEAQIKRRPATKKVSTAAAKQSKTFSQQKLTIGLDLGDRNNWYCVVDEAGEIQLEQRVRTTAKALQGVFGTMARSRIALGNRDAFALDQSYAERLGTRSGCGECAQGAADRREPQERRSPGCAEVARVGWFAGLMVIFANVCDCSAARQIPANVRRFAAQPGSWLSTVMLPGTKRMIAAGAGNCRKQAVSGEPMTSTGLVDKTGILVKSVWRAAGSG